RRARRRRRCRATPGRARRRARARRRSAAACRRCRTATTVVRQPDRSCSLSQMIFRQFTHDDLGCASYLIGDEKAGVAAVVDPRFEIDAYLELARYFHVTIEHILETHNHADHLSGHGRLAAATGAAIHIHREASPDYDHES